MKLFFLILIGLLILGPLAFGQTVPFSGNNSYVNLNHYIPKLGKGGEYTEKYTFNCWTYQGYEVHIEFFISNIGIGNNKGGIDIGLKLPNGKDYGFEKNYKYGKWQFAKDKFEIRFGESVINGNLNQIRTKLVSPEFSVDLTFQNVIPAWRPKNGVAYINAAKGQFYDITVMTPRAYITGEITVKGQAVKVTGHGYSDVKIVNAYPHKQAKSWYRLKAFNKDYTILFSEYTTPEKTRVPWLLVGYKNKIIFESCDYELKGLEYYNDRASANHYQFPVKILIRAQNKNKSLEGYITATQQLSRGNPLAKLNAFLRLILERFSKPIIYYYACNVQLTIKEGDKEEIIKSGGFYGVTMLNK